METKYPWTEVTLISFLNLFPKPKRFMIVEGSTDDIIFTYDPENIHDIMKEDMIDSIPVYLLQAKITEFVHNDDVWDGIDYVINIGDAIDYDFR